MVLEHKKYELFGKMIFEKAAELLAISDERVSDIACNTGFNDLSHFSKCFQEKYNAYPSVYRLNQKHKLLD